MKKTLLLLVTACLALAACQPAGTPLPSLTAPPPPTAAPTATLTPAVPPAPPTPQGGAGATPQGGADATPTTPAKLTDPAAPAAFLAEGRCQALPGLPACRADALPVSGRLALVMTVGGQPALVVADFKAGTAWWIQKLPAQVSALRWAPSGKVLAVFYFNGKEATYLADGTFSGNNSLTPAAVWNPQDMLEAVPFWQLVFNAAGDRAWVDGYANVAHIQPAGAPGKEITWPLAQAPGDKNYMVLAWVPGADLLLLGSIQGGNNAMLLGPHLAALDVKTGKVQDFDTSARSAPAAAQWHPSQKSLLVYAETGSTPQMGSQRLAALNLLTGEKKYLISDENVSVSAPSFTPDGQAVIFAASLPAELAGPGHPYAALAIYRLPLAGGQPTRLTTPPAGFQDVHPALLADGLHFIYFRMSTAIADASGLARMTARLGALDGSSDADLTASLYAPACRFNPDWCTWESVAAFTP